jgi:hypothetical protein
MHHTALNLPPGLPGLTGSEQLVLRFRHRFSWVPSTTEPAKNRQLSLMPPIRAIFQFIPTPPALSRNLLDPAGFPRAGLSKKTKYPKNKD